MEKSQENKATNKNKVFFLFFVIIWGGIIIWNIVTPAQTFSEAENRNLAKFPTFSVDTLLDGGYMEGVSTYLNDQFVWRPYWVGAHSLVEYGTGKRELNSIYIGDNALLAAGTPEDENIAKANIEGINAFVKKYQMPTYTMLVPSSTAIQPQNLPFFAEGWDEIDFIAKSYEQLSEEVKPINAWRPLKEQSEEYIYYRTDHHWTTYGASLAYEEMIKVMEISGTKSAFEKETVSDSFQGTYQSKTGFPLIEADKIEVYQSGKAISYDVFDGVQTKTYDSIYFNEYLEKKDQYSYFLGPVQPYVTVHTNANTGKSILIFKDSYAHCLVPMLLSQYDEIRLVDLRYLNGTEIGNIVEAKKYDKTLFLFSSDVFAHQNVSGKLK